MTIDRAYVEATIQNCRQQEREFTEAAAKARGAIILAEALLARLDEKEPEPTTKEPDAAPAVPK